MRADHTSLGQLLGGGLPDSRVGACDHHRLPRDGRLAGARAPGHMVPVGRGGEVNTAQTSSTHGSTTNPGPRGELLQTIPTTTTLSGPSVSVTLIDSGIN